VIKRACAAGLALQHAGVHDGRSVAEGICAAGWQLALAIQLTCSLSTIDGISPRDAVHDALNASSHIYRFQHFSSMVLVD